MKKEQEKQRHNSEKPERKKLGLGSLVVSVLGAAIGVQNRKNLEKDFEQSSPLPYIIAGIVFTALFMLSLIMIVRWVLSS